MKIGIIGAEINNVNLGCQALTWSLLKILNDISRESQTKFEYYIMEGNPNIEKKNIMCKELGIEPEQVFVIRRGNITELIRGIRHINNNIKCFGVIKNMDVIIDLTQGDGFSDIYGTKRFNVFYGFLKYVIKKEIPLILGPQTYGPMFERRNIIKCKKIFKNSLCVMARDELSSEFVKEITNIQVVVTNDLAFQLPYKKDSVKKQINENKIHIGLNISSLMADVNKNAFNEKVNLSYKYLNLIEDLLDLYCSNDRYQVHLIPHVMDDVSYVKKYENRYNNVVGYKLFESPIEAKNVISNMDVFIGSRMHATIASLSSGVVTIPIAYSRKFEGVFNLLNYKHTINLYEMEIDEALQNIASKVITIDSVSKEVERSLEICEEYNQLIKNTFKKVLQSIGCLEN